MGRNALMATGLGLIAVVLSPWTGPAAAAETNVQDSITIELYDGFDADLAEIIQRSDNKIHPVNSIKKNKVIQSMKSFASTLGIPASGLTTDTNGRVYGKTTQDGNITAYFNMRSTRTTGDNDKDARENLVLKARKTWSFGTKGSALPDTRVTTLADAVREKYSIAMPDGTDSPYFASTLQIRETKGAEDDASDVVRQIAGYYRKVGGRQVVNSTFRAEIDNFSGSVVGMSLRNWWGLGAAKSVTLKSATTLKKDVLQALRKNGSRSMTLVVSDCKPTYYQAANNLLPALTCDANLKVTDGAWLNSSPTCVTVSLASGYLLDESDLLITGLADDATVVTAAAESEESDDPRFRTYYTTDEDRFWDGANKFNNEFDPFWTAATPAPAWARESHFEPADPDADQVDLVYATGHGAIRKFTGEDGTIYLNETTSFGEDNISQLGNADIEYLLLTHCHTGSAIWCEGMSATSRYTSSSSRYTVFEGLHLQCGHHGTSISSSDIAQSRANSMSTYLQDGLSVLEAWDDSADDINDWHVEYDSGCWKIPYPSTDCSMTGKVCSRWNAYPGTFYIDSQRNETLNNRTSSPYSSDYRKGNSNYDVDVHYWYQDEYRPIYSVGHSLP